MDPTPWRKQRLLVKDILVHAKKLGSDEIETHVVKIVDVSRKINGVEEAIKRVVTNGPTPTRPPIDDRYAYDAGEYQRRLEREQLAQMQANGFPGQAWGGIPFTDFGGSPSW